MTKNEFKMIIARIGTVWRVNFDDLTKEIYAENIGDLDYQKTLLVVKKLTQTEKYPPTIAHIREEYLRLESPVGNTIDALTLLNKAVQDFGRYKQIEAMEWLKGQDQATYEIVKAIGYGNICNADPNFMRPEFEKIHKEVTKELKEQAVISNRLSSEIAQISTQIRNRALLTASDFVD